MVTNNLSSATTQTTLEALQSLLQIEVKFAALRDQLYVEKMDELSREEEVIADGKLISEVKAIEQAGLNSDSSYALSYCRLPSFASSPASNPSGSTRKSAPSRPTSIEAKRAGTRQSQRIGQKGCHVLVAGEPSDGSFASRVRDTNNRVLSRMQRTPLCGTNTKAMRGRSVDSTRTRQTTRWLDQVSSRQANDSNVTER